MRYKSASIGEVPEHWNVAPLRDFIDLITYGFTNPMPDAEDGPWKVTAKDVVGGRIQYSTARRTTAHAFATLLTDKSRPKIGDVLLTKDGSIGRIAVVDRDNICINQSVALLRPNQRILPRYLAFLLRSPFYQARMEGDSDGSTIKHIYITRVDKMEVAVPPVYEQVEHLSLLGTIDDRIDLLRETNATLEAIAQALFKSWFVDFDPVRAKAQGLDPEGMPPEVADLFPSEFEDSELGEIPKGWRVGSVGEIADVIDCLHAKKPELLPTGKPFLQLSNIRDDGLLDLADVSAISEADYSKWTSRIEVRQGDCVITNVGRVGAVAQIPLGFRGAMGRNMTAIRPKPDYPHPTYLVELLQSRWMRGEIERLTDVGTILNALNVKSIPQLRCALSASVALNAFEDLCRPLRASMEHNLRRVDALAGLRDTLLPRLMSGKLRIPEIQEAVEEATA